MVPVDTLTSWTIGGIVFGAAFSRRLSWSSTVREEFPAWFETFPTAVLALPWHRHWEFPTSLISWFKAIT
jgi:hypothetical protein